MSLTSNIVNETFLKGHIISFLKTFEIFTNNEMIEYTE